MRVKEGRGFRVALVLVHRQVSMQTLEVAQETWQEYIRKTAAITGNRIPIRQPTRQLAPWLDQVRWVGRALSLHRATWVHQVVLNHHSYRRTQHWEISSLVDATGSGNSNPPLHRLSAYCIDGSGTVTKIRIIRLNGKSMMSK